MRLQPPVSVLKSLDQQKIKIRPIVRVSIIAESESTDLPAIIFTFSITSHWKIQLLNTFIILLAVITVYMLGAIKMNRNVSQMVIVPEERRGVVNI